MNVVECPNCHHKYMPAAGYTPLSVVKCAHCQHIYLMGQGEQPIVQVSTEKMGEWKDEYDRNTVRVRA